jgi:hypothetical protein
VQCNPPVAAREDGGAGPGMAVKDRGGNLQ